MQERRKRKKTLQIGRIVIEHLQMVAVVLALYDFAAVCIGYFLALFLRYDCAYNTITEIFLNAYLRFILPWAAASILIFVLFRMYNSMWRFASFIELIRTFLGSLTSSLLHALLITVIFTRMPVSYYLWGAGLQFILLVSARFGFRFIQLLKSSREPMKEGSRRIMLIGAGDAGQASLRDIIRAREVSDRVICIIDDNPSKWHRSMEGVPIVGGRDDILSAVEKYQVDEIFLAIPSATVQQKRDILAICSETGCKLKLLPGLYRLVTGEVSVSSMREVSTEDLLDRNLIRMSGFKPDVDIKIEYTGLRPGEKLYEEKLMEEEGLKKTDNDLIHIGNPVPFDEEQFLSRVGTLMEAAYSNRAGIREMVSELVPTYCGGNPEPLHGEGPQ